MIDLRDTLQMARERVKESVRTTALVANIVWEEIFSYMPVLRWLFTILSFLFLPNLPTPMNALFEQQHHGARGDVTIRVPRAWPCAILQYVDLPRDDEESESLRSMVR